MKKFWLATVGLLALGMAAPASAADLAARPYTKAPPAPVVAVYDWTGFYIGANGGGGSSHKCLAGTNFRVSVAPFPEACRDACRAAAGGANGYPLNRSRWGVAP